MLLQGLKQNILNKVGHLDKMDVKIKETRKNSENKYLFNSEHISQSQNHVLKIER